MPENVVICGGGVIGGAIAYYLSLRGVGATIIESDGLASGASGAAAGLLSPPLPSDSPLYELQRRGFDLHLELATVLPAQSGVEYGFARAPRMTLAVSQAEETEARAAIEAAVAAGLEARWIEPVELRELSGWIDGGDARGAALHEPGAYLDAYQYSLALVTAAERMGATVRSGKVSGIARQDGRVVGVQVGNDVVPANTVVVAMGPWSVDASDWLGLRVAVEPLKGQIVKVRPRRPLRPFTFAHAGNYAVAKGPAPRRSAPGSTAASRIRLATKSLHSVSALHRN